MIKPYYESSLCACGCGSTVERSKQNKSQMNRFINGHNNKNRQFSNTHKQKISASMEKAWEKRTPPPITYEKKFCSQCKNVFFVPLSNKNKKFCSNECFKKHCSAISIGENNNMYGTCGELSPTWQGGISFEPYPIKFNRRFKSQIREIDNNICQICEKAEKKKLDVHHIDYDKKNITTENLISLCKSCHVKTNFNRECWINYFRSRLNAS